MAVLDTSFLVDIIRAIPAALDLLEKLERTENALFVAAPSVMELWAGTLKGKKTMAAQAQIDQFLSSLNILPLDAKSAKCAAEIEAELLKDGLIIETEDIMIAGIAMANGESVVTKDLGYTRVQGIKVLKY